MKNRIDQYFKLNSVVYIPKCEIFINDPPKHIFEEISMEKILIKHKSLKKKNISLNKEIINYLCSKGEIKACLLHKLCNHLERNGLIFEQNKEIFLNAIIQMLKKGEIEIIIPRPYTLLWQKKKITNLKYLHSDYYYYRSYQEWPERITPALSYLFDSRKSKFNMRNQFIKTIEHLIQALETYPDLKYHTIILYPRCSKQINIYENLYEPYSLENLKPNHPLETNYPEEKLKISLNEQKSNLSNIQSFRDKYMCFYITLIESIHRAIVYYQSNKKFFYNYSFKIAEFTRKFGYYCLMYVRSDWIDIDANPYRWESFFKTFNLPIKILDLSFKHIKFYESTFVVFLHLNYCIFIKRGHKILNDLKKMGYKVLEKQNTEEDIAIGLNLEIYIPCPAIEYFYFIGKYVVFYYLFKLFDNSFEYIKYIKPIIFTDNDRNIYQHFFPILNSLFTISSEEISRFLLFKYDTLNSVELEVLYNKFLVSQIKNLESRLYRYFLIKHAQFKKNEESLNL